ncbi:KTSC domain-containing protein [Streptomyces prunicolor]|uniref:KTSC domain-containing protein n=1 Tax=Streptomyces prunicolor TaxID=67348 RepID=A0ABU4F665_9ACTN|nr:KTSC domain-containing protein [Streptomyces prunicolor]MDV7215481.1 KTSC domain-containing protein [Streptomyces prunicolor]
MQRTPVSSSNLASVGYEPSTGVLEIQFRSRSIYQYFNVPTSAYQGLMAARSKGSYHAHFILGRYRYKRLA